MYLGLTAEKKNTGPDREALLPYLRKNVHLTRGIFISLFNVDGCKSILDVLNTAMYMNITDRQRQR